MIDRIFIDTNIWIYLFLQDDNKKYITVENFFKNNTNATFFITYQVINELSNILLKNKYSENKIREYIEYLYKICTIQDFTKEIVLRASILREKYSFSFWDSIIVGSALYSNCNALVSEDMQNGLLVEQKLLIKSIFI